MKQLTQKQRWAACDVNMSDPVELQEANLMLPFVYDREYGLFYVPGGYHPAAQSLLLAFHHGLRNGVEASEMLGLEYSCGTAEAWLALPGTAFRSSVSKRVCVGKKSNLSENERDHFAFVNELLADDSGMRLA